MPTGMLRVWGMLCAAAMIGACGEAEPSDAAAERVEMGGADPTQASGPTWHADIAPVVDRTCNGCHYTGGIAPFVFETYADFSAVAAAPFSSRR